MSRNTVLTGSAGWTEGAAQPLTVLGLSRYNRPFKATMPLTAGTRLGHYDVTALLGEGGMGEAYRAHAVAAREDG